MKNISLLVLTICFFSTFMACEKEEVTLPTIAAIAVENPNFSTLEGAAVQGGVALTLSNPNPGDPSGDYTVFAPTNDAFARLGLNKSGDLGALRDAFLTNTLLYHVSNGNLKEEQFEGATASALGPQRRFIQRDGEQYINGSKIVATNISAENGTVHVIDKVLLATGADIVQSAIALQSAEVFVAPELSFLVEAVLYADLAGALSANEDGTAFTVFAPTDAAFRQLGQDLGVALEVPADIRKLDQATVTAVLLNHVIADGGKFTSEMNAGQQAVLGGGMLTFGAYTDGVLNIQGNGNNQQANMVIPDVLTTNGVVHVIDRVLLP